MATLPEIPLTFPNVGNALAAGAHAAYYTGRARLDQAEEQRKLDAQQYVQPAMQGDQTAMGNLAYGDPKAALAITGALQRMDANQRANVKAAADYTAQASNAILQADPGERPALYQQLYAEGRRRGYNMGSLPPTYSPALDGMLRTQRAMAVPITEWFKTQEGIPQPMGGGLPQGNAGPASAGFANNSGNIRSTAPGNYNGFATYETPDAGASAHFQNYQAYVKENPNITVAQAIAKWSPPNENNTNGIISQLAESTGINPGMKLSDVLSDAPTAARLLEAQTRLEKGGLPPGFTSDTFLKAASPQGAPVQLAGPPQAVPAPNAPAAPAGAPSAPPTQGLTAGVKLAPGQRMMGIKGVPVVKDGNVLVLNPDGSQDWVPMPKPTERPQPPQGYRWGAVGPDGKPTLEPIPGGPQQPDVWEDVKDNNGNVIGQRNKKTNQYHPIQPVPGASNIDPNLKGDDVYAALPPARAAEIRSIVNGDSPIPPPTSRAPYAQETRALVFQAAGPGFTDALHAQRMTMKKDMNTGKIGQALQAQGTLFNHMDHALDIADNLNNSPYPVVNKALNAVGLAQGDPRVVELEATKTRINQELEKYFAGHTTVSGLAEARNELNAAQSPEQIKAAIRTLATLVNGQQSELVHRINRGLGYTGDKALTLEDPLIISPEGAKARDDVLARTQAGPNGNSKLMDQGKQLFGAKKPGERPPLSSFEKKP